jgi:ubiquinone/menaquinone biosynthesis C-methylase UbiE
VARVMQRRYREERMDGRDLDRRLLAGDLHNLELLNRLFGGRAIVRKHLECFLNERGGERLRILDVGSGAGDLCREVVHVCRDHAVPVTLYSLDSHPQIQAYARERLGNFPEIHFIRSDGRRLPARDGAFDITLCTLALHHFTEEDAVVVLSEMRRVTRGVAVASDLCRTRVALVAVWLATRFTLNPMTRFDGPVSVERAFTGPELKELARRAGWAEARLEREPWFRMSLVCRRDG